MFSEMSHLTTSMYIMRPFTTPPVISPPQEVMYKMQNIHAERFLPIDQHMRRLRDTVDTKMPSERDLEQHNQFEFLRKQILRRLQGKELLPEYHELEARQSKILIQLADLKKQVSTLSHFLKQSNGNKLNENDGVEAATDCVASTQVQELTGFKNQVSTLSNFLKQSSEATKSNENDEVEAGIDCIPSTQKPVNIDMVVHADSAYPPYSILALQKLWNDVDIRVTSYKHSTSTSSIQLILPPKKISSTVKTIIHLSLIWKDTEDLEVVTGMDRCTIIGEVNFLRYLSRLIDTHNYEKIYAQPHLLDTVLDWCYKTHKHLETECTYDGVNFYTITHNIEKWSNYYQKEHDIVKHNIADVALWSLIKQFPLKNKPRILDKWYNLCEKTFIDKNL